MRWLALSLTLAACSSRPVLVDAGGDVRQGDVVLEVGDKLNLDEPLVVGRGRAMVELADGSTVRIYDASRVSFLGRREVRLWLGKAWATVTHVTGGDAFTVTTDNAVAGVRGTEFVVQADEDSTDVRVHEGEVVVHNLAAPQSEQRVIKGRSTHVRGKRPPSEPESFDARTDHEAWNRLVELFHAMRDVARDGRDAVRDEVAPKVKDGAEKVKQKLDKLLR